MVLSEQDQHVPGAIIAFPSARATFTRSSAWDGWQGYTKRMLDVVGAIVLLVILAPVMAAIAIAIKLDSPGSVIFGQTRCGKDGIPFTFYKFRGMVADAEARKHELLAFNEADGPLFKMRHDPRVTRVGRFIRATSLDELPQIWNVLKGDMSLVGPRPGVPSEVDQYAPWHRQRMAVVGGMTGLWQVSGRSELSFEQMVHLDIEYVERWSLWLDIVILLRTAKAVLTTRGAF